MSVTLKRSHGPAVFVHGIPETAAVWGPMLAGLGREDAICLSPPGFGTPVPGRFEPTPTSYRNWLICELERIGAPVDLVGHDWGGGHVVGVAMERPDLLRSWISDSIGIYHPEYVWHDTARIFQTPGDGENQIAALIECAPAERAAQMQVWGMGEAAEHVAAEQDADMGRATLALYRAAAQPTMALAGQRLHQAAARPGLVVLATDDHFVGTEPQIRETARRAGAALAVLPDVGHWWMIQDPRAGAGAISRFWASLHK
ncbi:alpha/beta fold hydrolase [Streptomyces sp. NPDC059396]|uniref:alpha/beta fold hydrolase n=1 Tax=Streptomyces sp. NPDC059396 TaxID=3346819 RepID=UPI0036A2FE94